MIFLFDKRKLNNYAPLFESDVEEFVIELLQKQGFDN